MKPNPDGRSDATRTPTRGAFRLALAGTALAFFAFVSYFLIIPRWETLRDSGAPSIALAFTGAAISLAGLIRAWRSGRWRWSCAALFLFASMLSVTLTGYIHVLSYELPDTDDVLQVGSRAPPLGLRDQRGERRILGDGDWLLIDFFRGPW